MPPAAIELLACYLVYKAIFFLMLWRGARAFFERHLPLPDVTCPHCKEEVLSPYEAAPYYSRRIPFFVDKALADVLWRKQNFQCPFCEKWSHLAMGTAIVALVVAFFLALIVYTQIPFLWLRVPAYLLGFLVLNFYRIMSIELIESPSPPPGGRR